MAVNKVIYDGTTLIDLTSDTVTAATLLSGYKAHDKSGTAVTGSMANKGAVTGTISTKDGSYTIPAGYHNGSGTVSISSTEQAKIIAANIRSGITLFGVAGSGVEVVTVTIPAAYSSSSGNGYIKFSTDNSTWTYSTSAATLTIAKGSTLYITGNRTNNSTVTFTINQNCTVGFREYTYSSKWSYFVYLTYEDGTTSGDYRYAYIS